VKDLPLFQSGVGVDQATSATLDDRGVLAIGGTGALEPLLRRGGFLGDGGWV